MAFYTVLARPAASAEVADPSRFVLVKEGFSWPALILPELWLIVRALWSPLILYVAAAFLLIVVNQRYGVGLALPLLVLVRLFLGLEGNGIRRATLERRGYAFLGVIEARNKREGEVLFAHRNPPEDPPPPPAEERRDAVIALPPPGPAPDVVGLFPAPSPGGAS
jgi:hypothetical protein